MTSDIKYFVKTCETCKKIKKEQTKILSNPIKGCLTRDNSIGCSANTTSTGKLLSLYCKTMIDPATGWFEIKEMKDTNNSADVSRIFNNELFSRYPRPKRVIMDNGSEFKRDFKPLLKTYGIKAKHISVKNP